MTPPSWQRNSLIAGRTVHVHTATCNLQAPVHKDTVVLESFRFQRQSTVGILSTVKSKPATSMRGGHRGDVCDLSRMHEAHRSSAWSQPLLTLRRPAAGLTSRSPEHTPRRVAVLSEDMCSFSMGMIRSRTRSPILRTNSPRQRAPAVR